MRLDRLAIVSIALLTGPGTSIETHVLSKQDSGALAAIAGHSSQMVMPTTSSRPVREAMIQSLISDGYVGRATLRGTHFAIGCRQSMYNGLASAFGL